MKIGRNGKIVRSMVLAGVLLSASLGMVACTIPSDPGAPVWDIPMAIPFAEQRFGLDSLIAKPDELEEDGSGIIELSSGLLAFEFTDSVARMEVKQEDLKFDAEQEQSFEVLTENLNIDVSSEYNADIPVAGIVLGHVPGTDLTGRTIPPGEQQVSFDELDSIRVVRVETGSLDLTVTNDSELTWDEIVISLTALDAQGEPIPGEPQLGNFTLTNLGPRSNETVTVDLAGDNLRQNMRVGIEGTYQSQQNFTYDADDALKFGFTINPLSCDYAEAILAPQDPWTDREALEFDQNDWIINAIINSGEVVFTLENETDVAVDIDLVFEEIWDNQADDTLRQHLRLEAAEDGVPFTASEALNLREAELRLDIGNQALHARTTVRVEGSDGEYASLEAGEVVRTRFYTTELEFQGFSGVPKGLEYTVDEETQHIDIFDDQQDLQESLAGNLALGDVHIDLEMENEFDIPVKLIMDFVAHNTRHDPPLSATLIDTIELDRQQGEFRISNIEDLMNIFPDELTMTAKVQTGRDYIPIDPFSTDFEPYSLSVGTGIEGEFIISSPFSLVVRNETEIAPAVTEMGDKFEAPLRELKLMASIRNTVPLGGAVYLLAGVFDSEEDASEELVLDNLDTYSLLTLNNAAIEVPIPELDSETHRAVEPAELNDLIFTIPKEKLDIFAEEGVFFRTILLMRPTLDEDDNPITISAYKQDAIFVTLGAEATYRVNENGDDDDEGGNN